MFTYCGRKIHFCGTSAHNNSFIKFPSGIFSCGLKEEGGWKKEAADKQAGESDKSEKPE